MRIQCSCGSFHAELPVFPRNSPGRLVCYCDDCQQYLEKLGRAELLDDYGGTEVIPVYPGEFVIVQGREHLRCNRLRRNGLSRWSTTCCNSPIVNTKAGFPWAGILHSAYTAADADMPRKLGAVRSRIMGRYAKGSPPFRISPRIGIGDMAVVLPFVVKGLILRKHRPSPFYGEDGRTPTSEPFLL